MKVVIFAGGRGTRIEEESNVRPKPMIKIGELPLLLHIINIYLAYGYNDFIICSGYKGDQINSFFNNYSKEIPFKIQVVDTGIDTMTGGRLKRVESLIDTENFMLTYGDGLSDLNIDELVTFHHKKGKVCTMTTVQPQSRFGIVDVGDNDEVNQFTEKPKEDGTWINGGFFVLKKEIFNYLEPNSDEVMWESEPLNSLIENRELVAFKYRGFWKCLDTPRDKDELEMLWKLNPPWKKSKC